MKNVQLLDTTLRDGMYVTNFSIDDSIKRNVITGLEDSGVDIIECGFLKPGGQKLNSAEYASVENISPYIMPKKSGTMYAAICMLIEGDAPDIVSCDDTTVDVIRIAAFKHGMTDALRLAEEIRDKGYKVMLQPSRTSDYSESEMRRLIQTVNDLGLYSFAIVDSFGNMLPDDVLRLNDLYEEYLSESVRICYHFHNNFQMAFANSIVALESKKSEHDIVLDASIFGMGRGAGNLPVELIMQYMNQRCGKSYDINVIFELYEKYFLKTFIESQWGYQPRTFIAAKYDVNPYYSVYLESKYGLNSRSLDTEFSMMNDDCKVNFIKKLADEIGTRNTNGNAT